MFNQHVKSEKISHTSNNINPLMKAISDREFEISEKTKWKDN